MASEDADVQKRLRALRRSLPRPAGKKPVPRLTRPGSWTKRLQTKLLVGAGALALFWFFLPPFYWPVRAPESSGFLFRLKPDSRAWSLEIHHGVDLAAPRGTAVHPAAAGIVGAAGRSPELGNYVQVSHLFGFSTLYAHLDRIDVGPGQLVFPGLQVLGAVGSTGRSTGPHLHFGAFLAGFPLPPGVLTAFHSLRRAALGG